jgi:hypothetical protein
MLSFKVSKGLINETIKVLMKSNKLEHTFHNVGTTFIINKSDLNEVEKILKRNFIRIY